MTLKLLSVITLALSTSIALAQTTSAPVEATYEQCLTVDVSLVTCHLYRDSKPVVPEFLALAKSYQILAQDDPIFKDRADYFQTKADNITEYRRNISDIIFALIQKQKDKEPKS